jgi:hypothetical protein
MRKLRIVEKQYRVGSIRYEIQTRLLGFLWWVNVVDEEVYDRDFHSLDAAKAELPYHVDPNSWPRKKVVYQNFEDKQ